MEAKDKNESQELWKSLRSSCYNVANTSGGGQIWVARKNEIDFIGSHSKASSRGSLFDEKPPYCEVRN